MRALRVAFAYPIRKMHFELDSRFVFVAFLFVTLSANDLILHSRCKSGIIHDFDGVKERASALNGQTCG